MAESWEAKVAKASQERSRKPLESVMLDSLPDQLGDAQAEPTDTKSSRVLEEVLVATASVSH